MLLERSLTDTKPKTKNDLATNLIPSYVISLREFFSAKTSKMS